MLLCVLVAQLCPTLCNPMDCSLLVPLSMDFSRQEYWSGLPFPSPGHIPNPAIEPGSPTLHANSLPSEPPVLKGDQDLVCWPSNVFWVKLQSARALVSTFCFSCPEDLRHSLLLSWSFNSCLLAFLWVPVAVLLFRSPFLLWVLLCTQSILLPLETQFGIWEVQSKFRKSTTSGAYLVSWGFPGGSDDKGSVCNVRDPGSIPGLGRYPGEGNGSPLQYSCLENPMDRGAWQATVHRVTQSQQDRSYLATHIIWLLQPVSPFRSFALFLKPHFLHLWNGNRACLTSLLSEWHISCMWKILCIENWPLLS